MNYSVAVAKALELLTFNNLTEDAVHPLTFLEGCVEGDIDSFKEGYRLFENASSPEEQFARVTDMHRILTGYLERSVMLRVLKGEQI